MIRSVHTLLLVDNAAPDRERHRRFLLEDSSCTYHLLEAESAAVGLELCRTHSIDAILLSSNLLDANGLEFLEALQAQSHGSSPSVVMLADEETTPALSMAIRAIKLGAEDYLLKHLLTPESLQLSVRSAIENTRFRVQLQQSEDRFRVSIENMLDCFGIFSALRDQTGQIVDFRFDYLNAAALASNQMTVSDLGKTLCEVFPAQREMGLLQKYCQVVETGEPLIKENLLYSDTFGTQYSTRIYDVRVGKLGDGLVVSWRDVTERKRVEETVQQQLAEIEAIYTTAPVGLCFLDTDLRFVRINQQLAEMNGVPVSEHLGRTLREILPDMADQLEPLYRQVIESGEPILNREVEGTNQAQPGVLRYWLVCYYPQKERHQRVVGVNVMVQEITERKRIEAERIRNERDREHTEAALRESEQRLKAIIDNSTAAIFMKDLQGRYLLMNRECEKLFHITNDWICGKTDNDLFPKEVAEALRENDRQVIASGQALTLEEEVPLEDGIHTYVAVKFPLLDSQGNPCALCGISTDISDRVRLQQERDRLLVEAEAAREEAEAANRSKDEFVAVVAHELRSPLNSVAGWAKLLQTRKFDEATIAKGLETIWRNTQAQVQLVEDLLDISRMIRGTLQLTFAPVDLAQVIDSALDLVRPMAATKRIQLETSLFWTPQISGDFNRLQQIVVNLLTNAIKFTAEEGRVNVQLESRNSEVLLRIQDTGKGIAPEFLPQIFEQFRQEQQATGAKDGLGLGLAIVKNLVELHYGTVTAESAGIGQGSTFTVYLPQVETPDIEAVSQSAQGASTSLDGIRILAVDDEPDMLNLITFVLQDAGAEVESVSSGAAALDCLSEFKPDILLSDIAMPDRNGYELIQQVKELSEAQIPAIALTSYASATYRERSRLAGFQLHLTKPFEPERLVGAILSIVKKTNSPYDQRSQL